ncbi:VirB8/TrbF family protein [Luteibacter sp. 3190]|uniref:virB8 family protein n=1 Tax=Luteibacter sp. 3190 TaxID=2817736 RepID=UPI0028661F08|nr:VirB8/TrbF family protein [Luteibacter sp. 3190]MDR6935015.1 type IV secretion system protein VirB8 [Luteibacter sp. 3190]
MLRKRNSAKIDAAVAQGVNFEVSIADIARRGERRAWIVAWCAVGMSLILAGGYFYMLPLKQTVPYVVLADAASGVSSLARLSDDLVNRRITSSEAVNRSNVAHFVLARESYDLALTNLRDWPTVLTMASEPVAKPYLALHAQNNEKSPYKLYGKSKAIRVKILSIVLLGGGPDTPPTGATVRFQRSLFDKTNGATTPIDSKIATIEFTYKANLGMDDQYRIENPLGFQVMSYRVDNDYASSPPSEVLVPGQAATSAAQPVSDDGSSSLPQDGAQNPQALPPANAQPTATAIPLSTIPGDDAYASPQGNAGVTPTQATAPPGARTNPRSAANGGRR